MPSVTKDLKALNTPLRLISRSGLVILFFIASFAHSFAQENTVKGKVIDKQNGEDLIGASVVIKGTTIGTVTDIDGNFEFKTNQSPPFTLKISFIGYLDLEYEVLDLNDNIKIKLGTDQVLMDEVQVVGSRISEKEQLAALSTESMDVLSIKEAPSGNFYESLGNMKGVDVTSASMGFKVVNTRGFNSTSPVRSLQLIDGVDNQSPGLNFSLGNFLGASDLDVMNVEIVSGASSAFFGPGAFNGVINMTTKSPWLFKGLNAEVKVGERNLLQVAVRWADVIKNKEGKDKFGYKLNLFMMQANDWEANNMDPSTLSDDDQYNYAGYDAVNRYGDEVLSRGNGEFSVYSYPALGNIYRTGYLESDIVDYNTENLKANVGLYYMLTDKIEINYGFNYGTGTTVYQGDNRYSLKGIQFFQNKFEIKQEDKFFVRVFATNEDAGKSYDAVVTAMRMSDANKEEKVFYKDYRDYYELNIADRAFAAGMPDPDGGNYPSVPEIIQLAAECCGCAVDFTNPAFMACFQQIQGANSAIIGADQTEWALNNPDSMIAWNAETRNFAEEVTNTTSENPFYRPGTDRYDSLLADVTSRTFTEGGSLFYDKSALYNLDAQYQFNIIENLKATVGINSRLYAPNTNGTIFNDPDSITITNWNAGAYLGLNYALLDKKVILDATLRVDKNENFDPVFSPAISIVYSPQKDHTFRATFTTAVRNPTLADQYLYYDVGRAILIGNLTGYDSLVTVESLIDEIDSGTNFNPNNLEYFNVDAIKPEQVSTIEFGYRGMINKKFYLDLSYYYSNYTNFIGYVVGTDVELSNNGDLLDAQVYRIAANASDKVNTQGVNIGLNYYLGNHWVFNGNYSWNKLDLKGSDDPIIPAFNTPEHKFNIGVNGRDFLLFGAPNFGFGINYKWIEGFVFEGSPQFTGPIDTYSLLDAQINYKWAKTNLTFKLGASNILNNKVYQVYGGPRVGRLAYFSISYDWAKK